MDMLEDYSNVCIPNTPIKFHHLSKFNVNKTQCEVAIKKWATTTESK